MSVEDIVRCGLEEFLDTIAVDIACAVNNNLLRDVANSF